MSIRSCFSASSNCPCVHPDLTSINAELMKSRQSCHNSGCQSFIKYWIQHVILGLIPQVYFRFTLYFSKFVTEEDISTVETLNNWALELARLGIAVFFCPIIVSQTIKCRDNEIDVIINSDQELMTDYFALLTELQDSSGDAISCSHGFRSKISEDICLKSFASESQFICISQATSNPHLPYPMKVKKVITK